MPILPETEEDGAEIEALLDRAFGSDRSARTVYRLREGVAPVAPLCHVARDGKAVLRGSLRFWPIALDRVPKLLLLGPIAVRPEDQGMGYGRALMWHGLAEARRLGFRAVLLVGDEPYYGQFGFRAAHAEEVNLPGPFERHRLLGLPLVSGALLSASGMVEAARDH